MMTTIEIALIASLALSLLALFIAVISLKSSRKQAANNEKMLQKLVRDLAASNSGSVGMGQRLIAMEKRLQNTQKQSEKIDVYNDDEFQPYSQAAQMFQMGLDAEEVARRCGLSRAEASLLEVMQKAGR
jgi:Protein of unknown function (DUF2802)